MLTSDPLRRLIASCRPSAVHAETGGVGVVPRSFAAMRFLVPRARSRIQISAAAPTDSRRPSGDRRGYEYAPGSSRIAVALPFRATHSRISGELEALASES